MAVIVERERLERTRKSPKIPGGRSQPTPEQVVQFEDDLTYCLKDKNALMMVTGTEEERQEFMQTIRTWATDRPEGRVTVRLHEGRKEPSKTYYRLMPFVRKGHATMPDGTGQ